MTSPAQEQRDLIAQWAFDTRPILGRVHFWLGTSGVRSQK